MILPAQRHFLNRPSIVLLVLLAATLVAGCGGGGDGGDGDGDAPRRIAADDLDLGSYEAEGAEVPEVSGTLANGRAIAAGQLGEVLVDPSSLDEDLQSGRFPSGAVTSPSQLAKMFLGQDTKLFAKRVSGVGSRRGVYDEDPLEETTDVSITLLSFSEPRFASNYVKVVGDQNERDQVDASFGISSRAKRITLPGVTNVRAAEILVGDDDDAPAISVLSAEGRVVIIMYVTAPKAQLAQSKQLAATAIIRQREALADFESAPFERLLVAEVEGRDVAQLTMPLPESPEDQETEIPYVWGPKGALHVQSWAGDLAEAFERADLKHLAQGATNVYEAGSAKQARRLLEDLNEAATQTEYREKFSPKGLPDAVCMELVIDSPSRYPNVCRVQVGNYVGEVGGTTPDDAEDKLSAQFLILQDEVLGSEDE